MSQEPGTPNETPNRPLPGQPGEPVANDAQDEGEDFEALLNQHMPAPTGKGSSHGAIIEVPVVSLREEDVLVDIGGKAEASISLEEFPLVAGKRQVAVGDLIRVVPIGHDKDGNPRYSHREARARDAQHMIQQAMDSKTPVRGRITAVVKGGVKIDCGLDAFMPASQIDLFKIPDLNKLVGEEMEAYVIEFDPRRKRAVMSRRQLLFERREAARQGVMSNLIPGQNVKGRVKSVLEFGVFVDLGGIDGFIPRDEVSYDRGTSPTKLLKAGDQIDVRIVHVDPTTAKITLSRKQLAPDPWGDAASRYPVGAHIRGTVVSVQNYGAFVHLEEGITGMIHAGDLSWAAGNKKPGEFVKEGDVVTAQILEVDASKKRISLGLKQVSMDPWADVENRYPVGAHLKGTVRSLTNYGAFIRLDDYIDGMVHVSDITWEKRVNHPKEFLKVGDEVDVVVLKVELSERRVSLGIKQTKDSPFDAFAKAHPAGTSVTGKVTRFAPFGAFVELAPGLEGLIHISQIDIKRVEVPEKALAVGEEVTCKVVKYEAKNQKISLSRKEAIKSAERDQVKTYMRKTAAESASTAFTFGDALKQAREQQEQGE